MNRGSGREGAVYTFADGGEERDKWRGKNGEETNREGKDGGDVGGVVVTGVVYKRREARRKE